MSQYDVYISYAKEDSDWVRELVEEVESAGLKACWDIRDFNKEISSHENRQKLVSQSSSCLLVFSKAYCKRASEWSFFTKFLKSKVNSNDDKHSVTEVLDNKFVICVYLSECKIPSLFSKEKILKWTEAEYSDIFWQRLIKYLKSAKKKVGVKKALISKFQNISRDKEDHGNDTQIDMVNVSYNSNNSSIQDDLKDQILENEDSDSRNNNEEYINDKEKLAPKSIAENTKKMFGKINEHNKCLQEVHTSIYNTSEDDKLSTEKKQNEIKDPPKINSQVLQGSEKNQGDTATIDKISNTIENIQTNKDDDNEESTVNSDLNTTTSYEMFESVYPHLISSSFCAEDEDLTKEEVDSLTLKMEEMETIMYLNEKSPTSQNNASFQENISFEFSEVVPMEKQKSEFDSQHEQMQLLDILQSLHERIQGAMDKLAPNAANVSRKKRYRRLLKQFQDCIMKVVNGKKDSMLIQNLPLVSEYLEEIEDQCKCYCCGNLYHSKRALELHITVCVKETWAKLVQRKTHVNNANKP